MKSYGTLSLTNTSPVQVFSEPLTLGEVRAFLELPDRSPADQAEAAMLEGFITMARVEAERAQKRDLIEKQYDLALDHFMHYSSYADRRHCHSVEIRLRQPLRSVDLVQYRDSTGAVTELTEGTDYIVDLARGIILPPYNQSWPIFTPWPSSAVLIRFTSGPANDNPFWSNGGQNLLLGMKQLISHAYVHRLPFDTIPGQTTNEFPYAVTALLSAGANVRIY